MKIKSIKNIFLVALALVIGSYACTTNFDDYNDNPNRPYKWQINPSSMLESILYYGADGMLSRTKSWNGELVQYTVSSTTINAYHRYIIGNGVMSSTWNHLAQWAANADHMYKLSIYKDTYKNNKEIQNCMAVALTMKALFMSNQTDIFGDIPCSQAFMSDDFEFDPGNDTLKYEINFKPKFDTQKDVYIAIFQMLEQANKLYTVDKSITLPNKDLMYGGDMKRWKKFTNSLYLRLLMRLSNRDAEMAISKKIQDIVNNPTVYPIFESNTDNAALKYADINPFVNPFGVSTESDFTSDRKAADNLISMMTGKSDPRLPTFFKRDKAGADWKGLQSGEAEAGDKDGISLLNKRTLGEYSSPYAFMKTDEVYFILAEAAKRGMIGGGDAKAKEYYDKALFSSIEWWLSIDPSQAEVSTPEEIDTFINKTVKYNKTLGQILDQKYIALFWVGYEGWHDYRRTGYPQLRIGGGTESNQYTLPTRFAYPINTKMTNPDNYKIAVDRMMETYRGSDNMLTPVWWSKDGAQY